MRKNNWLPGVLLPLICIWLFSFSMQSRKRIIFFGDSITMLGVNPGGFITRLQDTLNKTGLDKNYELLGAGVSGDKVYDLYLRLDEDVLAKNPDAVVIWVGVNDVWHKIRPGTGTDADKFEKFYTAIIKKLQQKNIAVFLCTPATIGEKNDMTNEQDGDLNKYSVIIRNIAEKNNCGLIDLRRLFLEHLRTGNPDNKDRGILTTDGVHLNPPGNSFVARHIFAGLKNFIK